jgi:magnesium-protoporphyrin O-methyltransferase
MDASYLNTRARIETYFDRTAAAAWARLTSEAPVSGIRATVRAGRETMRRTLLSWLPDDLRGRRVLDAGCGTGALAVEVAARGADVLAVDLSLTLVKLAAERAAAGRRAGPSGGHLEFRAGDMLDPLLGRFDHVIGMDSLIHYRCEDAVRALGQLAARTECSLLFTFAPRTPLLAAMIGVGRLFPRADRAPFIEPVREAGLRAAIEASDALRGWRTGQSHRVAHRFYTSQAMELVRT